MAFELCIRLKSVPFGRLIESLSVYSFGIYLVHTPVQRLLIPWTRGLPLPRPVSSLVFAAVLLLSFWIIAFAIARVPRVGKLLLFLRWHVADKTGKVMASDGLCISGLTIWARYEVNAVPDVSFCSMVCFSWQKLKDGGECAARIY